MSRSGNAIGAGVPRPSTTKRRNASKRTPAPRAIRAAPRTATEAGGFEDRQPVSSHGTRPAAIPGATTRNTALPNAASSLRTFGSVRAGLGRTRSDAAHAVVAAELGLPAPGSIALGTHGVPTGAFPPCVPLLNIAVAVAQSAGGVVALGAEPVGVDAEGRRREARAAPGLCQAVAGAFWLRWSLSRLWVALISRHSDLQADLPRRKKRSRRRLNLVLAKTGSIVTWRLP